MTTLYRNNSANSSRLIKWFAGLFLGALLLASCSGGNSATPSPTPPPAQLTLDEYITSKNFSGVVLVRKNSRDVLRKAYGFADKAGNQSNTTQTRFRIGSVTKTFTAMAIVQLKKDGKIAAYADPVKTYLTTSPLSDQITIEHLLRHRSGISEHLDEINPDKIYTPAQIAQLFETDPLDFTPGSRFEYSNSNYIVLGLLMEQISGQSYFDYVKTAILDPLGLAATEYAKTNISGSNYAKGYLNPDLSTLADQYDMSIPYAAGALSSNLDNIQDWAASFEDLSLITQQDFDDIFANTDYGFGWGTSPIQGKKAYWHTGGVAGFSSIIVMLPDDNGLIILLSNVESAAPTIEDVVKYAIDTEF